MARRDTAQDIDRPHFYSQYWLDIAMGKSDATADHGAELALETDELDDDDLMALPEMPAPKPAKKPARVDRKAETARPTFTSLADLANIELLMKNSAEMEGDEVTDLERGTIDDLVPFEPASATGDASATALDFEDAQATTDDLPLDDELEFDDDEDEEGDDWGGRKPGKGKPKPPRRERRPNF
ncbi:MAG TPA: hypothetical protein VJN88_15120 [Ktedonobacterales bacterium]|nr:hypothetical protein [Ktedonobacterales bacterium]